MIIPEDGCLPPITRCGLSAFNNVMIIKVPENLRKPGETIHRLATLDRTKKGERWPADIYVDSILNPIPDEISTSESNQKDKSPNPVKKSPFKKTFKFQKRNSFSPRKSKTYVQKHSFDYQNKPRLTDTHTPTHSFPSASTSNFSPSSFVPNATFPNSHEANRKTLPEDFPNHYQRYNEQNNNSRVERNRTYNKDFRIEPEIPFNTFSDPQQGNHIKPFDEPPPFIDYNVMPPNLPSGFIPHNINGVSIPNSISNGFSRMPPPIPETFFPNAPRNKFNPISHDFPRKPFMPGPFISNPPKNSYEEADRANSNFVDRDMLRSQVMDNNPYMPIPRHRLPENELGRDNNRNNLPHPNSFQRDLPYNGERPVWECRPNPGFNRESGNRNERDSCYNETRKFWNNGPNPGFKREHGTGEKRNFYNRNQNFRNNRSWNERNGYNVKSNQNFSRGRRNGGFFRKNT